MATSSIDKEILNLIKKRNPDNTMEYLKDLVRPSCFTTVYKRILNCTLCLQCDHNVKSLPYGNPDAKVLVLTDCIQKEHSKDPVQYPFFNDEYNGEFDVYLDNLHVNKDIFYFMNCVNCYCSHYLESKGENIYCKPNIEQRNNCNQYVNQIIDVLEPKIIITMGAIATNSLSDKLIKINKDHGQMFTYRNIPVFCTFDLPYFDEIAKDYDEQMIYEYKCELLKDLSAALNYLKTECHYTNGLENLIIY